MANPSEWRWYSRDHGILLAIPVRERLPIGTKLLSEDAIADALGRLVTEQGFRNPPVKVVLIEPDIPCPSPTYRSHAILGSGFGEQGLGGPGGSGGGSDHGALPATACGCR